MLQTQPIKIPLLSMEKHGLNFLLLGALALAGCGKKAPEPAPQPTPQPTVAAAPSPTPPPAEKSNTDALVIVLCYHRVEGKAGGMYSLSPEEFEREMKALQDAGIAVISMNDYLAWKKGEKVIPPRSALITIDDGYVSGYTAAWPILKKFNYPFTMFVYTRYISVGGKSITWQQLEQMRDEGVDIQSHTTSHDDLVTPKFKPADMDYDTWLMKELADSKNTLEEKLGIRVFALSVPYGKHSPKVLEAATKAGYELLFTVNGRKNDFATPNEQIGRYSMEADKPQIFEAALNNWPGGGAPGGPPVSAVTAATISASPADGEQASSAAPVIKANLTAFGEIDPSSVQMRLSGIGPVSPKFDAASKEISYHVTQPLHDANCTVIITARAPGGGKKFETRWSFKVPAQ